jgi:eukaryotic-like serine/threonine-protein kinase
VTGVLAMNEESLFAAALEKATPAERQAFLDQACGGDDALRLRVERLLAAHEHASGILDRGADEGPGTVIGRYKLKEQIGEGGFGLVFVAEQHEPVRRKVALKVIKPGMDTRDVVARFEAERQALALMDHPNIAKVLDGGETDSGRPYFVMELVRGVAVTDYCDQNRLTTRGRLDLFVSACQAIQHAHQKGVIHRDVKPSNVLVTLHDGKPVPKVIDFGVAKALNQQLTEHSIYTRFAQMVGTPLYMSPEQAELSGLDVDTRADIYSLGVLLYELLTGTTPFDKERLKTAGFDEIRRIIREEEPPRPSTRVSTLGPAATVASANRRSDPRRLSRSLRGELDWVVMKALEKARDRRYATAADMARDVERYLRDEPVEACPPSAAYRLKKFARKFRRALATAAAFVAILIAGVIVSTWLAVRATFAEGRAGEEREAALAAQELAEERYQLAKESVEKFLGEVTTDPALKQRDLNKLRKKLLETAVPFYQKLAEQKGGNPKLEEARGFAYFRLASIRNETGDSEAALADCARMRAIFEKLAADFPEVPAHRQMLAASHNEAGRVLSRIGKNAEAKAAFGAALGIQQKLVTECPGVQQYRRELATSHNNLAGVQGRTAAEQAEAEAGFRAAVRIYEQLLSETPANADYRSELARCQCNLGLLLTGVRKHTEAETAFRSALLLQTKLVAEFPANPSYREVLADTHNGLGIVMARTGGPADDEFRAVVAVREKLAADFPTVPAYQHNLASSHNNLGRRLAEARKVAEAEAAYRAALTILEKLTASAPNVPDYAVTLGASYVNLSHLLKDSRRAHASLDGYTKAIAVLSAVLAKEPSLTSARLFLRNAHWGRAEALQELGRHPEAVKDWDRVIETNDEKQHEPFFRRARVRARALAGDLTELGANLLKQNKHAEAERVLRECLPVLREKQPDAWTTFHTQSLLGEALSGQGKYAEAEPLLVHGYEGMKQRAATIPTNGKARLTEALERLVQLYDDWGKPDEAAKWRAERARYKAVAPPPREK